MYLALTIVFCFLIGTVFFLCYKYKISLKNTNDFIKEFAELKGEYEDLKIKNQKLLNDNYKFELENQTLKNDLQHQNEIFKQQQEFQEKWVKQQQENQKIIFQNISNASLKEQNEIGTQKIDEILKPFKEEITKCKSAIDEVNLKTKTEINTKISEMLRYTQEVGKSADNLANAFKGDKKQQGNFGELKFKNLLEFYGFQENQDYYEQFLLKTDDEKNKYPDFILQTQPNKWLVIDSKFSISNYQKYIETEVNEEKHKYLKDYVNDLKNRIKELGEKEYHKLLQKNGKETFDFVCLFFGNEMAYMTAISNFEYRNEIFQLSAKYKVAILTSSSFAPILQMIRQIWEMEKFNKNIYNAREIIDKWLKKTTSFQENLEKVGKKIEEAKKIYDDAYGQLIDGKGSAIKLANDVLKTIKDDTEKQQQNQDEKKIIDGNLFLIKNN